MLNFFIKGLIIGFAIAAPVGPIGVLCIQRSLHDGFKMGLMTGMGAALADGTYGLVAGLGLTAVSSLLIAPVLDPFDRRLVFALPRRQVISQTATRAISK